MQKQSVDDQELGVSRQVPLYVVFNVASGSGDAQQNQRKMQEILRAAGRRHEFLLARDPNQIGQLAQRAASLASAHAGAVIAAGGDGTINAVAQAVLPTGRPFGIVPQGTFNYSSRAHAIPLDTQAATEALLDARLERMQVGLVNDRVFLVNASLGLYPQLLQDREAYKKQFGRYRPVALLSTMATLLRGHGLLALELHHDSGSEVVRTASLFVGNNPLQLAQAGLEAETIERGQLAGIVLQAAGTRALLRLVVRGALGRLGESDSVRSFGFHTLHARPALRGLRRLKVALDGEVCWMKPPIVFSVADQPLWLMTPRKQSSSSSAA
jgi:diacylglycerol kinase family enzyme